jgi:hypothetical protein
MWLIFYLSNTNQECTSVLLESIPDLMKKLTTELDSDKMGSVNRPIIRCIGNLLTYNIDQGQDLMYDEKF